MPGSILKIDNGKYRVCLDYGNDEKGSRVRKYRTVNTKKEATAILSQFETQHIRGQYVLPSKMKMHELISEWFDYNLMKDKWAETTAYSYRNIINNHLTQYFGSIEIQKIKPKHIDKYFLMLKEEKGLSVNTIHKHHDCLKQIFKYAKKNQLLFDVITDQIELPPKVRHEGKIYTTTEMKELLQNICDTPIEIAIYLASFLGLRRSEIVGLRWENVDLDNRLIFIKEVRTSAGAKTIVKGTKNNTSKRTLHIPDELYHALLRQKEKLISYQNILKDNLSDTDYVFTKTNGKPYRVNSLSEHFSKLLVEKNMKKIRLHDLRHSFASILHDQNVSLQSISEAMGHSNIGTTSKIYTHLFDKTHKNTVETISTAILG